MDDVHAGHTAEHLAREMAGRRHAGRCAVQFSGLGLGQRDQIRGGFDREIGAGHEHIGRCAGEPDRLEVFAEIEAAELQRGRKREIGTRIEQRVAVRVGARHDLGGDLTAGAEAWFKDHGLAENFLQPLRDQAGRGLWGRAENHPDGAVRIGFGAGRRGEAQQSDQGSGCAPEASCGHDNFFSVFLDEWP